MLLIEAGSYYFNVNKVIIFKTRVPSCAAFPQLKFQKGWSSWLTWINCRSFSSLKYSNGQKWVPRLKARSSLPKEIHALYRIRMPSK